MDYLKIYENLMERSRNRTLHEYKEKHHIIPKCLGGNDNIDNLVSLTPEEHYIAHLLLVKIYPKNSKLIFAANMMANRNNKSYGWIKRLFSIEQSNSMTGYKHSEESRKKMSLSRKDVPKTEHFKNIMKIKKTKDIEYLENVYKGWDELKLATNVSRHLYLKFYKNGIDPVPYINNNSYGIVEKAKTTPPKAALGKKWFNNGSAETYCNINQQPNGWIRGRLPRLKDEKGRFQKEKSI